MSLKRPAPRPIFASKKPAIVKAAQVANSSDESAPPSEKDFVSPTIIVPPPESDAFWWVTDPVPPPIGIPSKPTSRLANIISNIHWMMGVLLDLKNADGEALHLCRNNNEQMMLLRIETKKETTAIRAQIEQAFVEVEKVEGELDEVRAKIVREKARRQQLLGRVEDLSVALKAEQATTQELQRELAREARARADQERRLAALEAKLKNLRVPDARAVQSNAVEMMEQKSAARLQALTFSSDSMARAMQERKKQVGNMLHEHAEATSVDARLLSLVDEQVRPALQAQTPRSESPEPGVTATTRTASLTPPPSASRRPTLRAVSFAPPPSPSRQLTPVVPEPTTPCLPSTPARQPVPSTPQVIAPQAKAPQLEHTAGSLESNLEGPVKEAVKGELEGEVHEQSVPPASPAHSQATAASTLSPTAKRARNITPTQGYSGKADGGPSQKMSPAEQAKAKAKAKVKVVSQYNLRSCYNPPPEPEVQAGPSSASAASSRLWPVSDVEGDDADVDQLDTDITD